MSDQFFRSVDDIREEQEAVFERETDTDFALVSDYAIGALSDEEAAKVRQRIQTDPEFRDLAEPLLLAYEHRPPRPRLSEEERRRRFAQLCQRVGIAPAAPPDRVVGVFQREVQDEKRRVRRRRILFAAGFVLIMALPPAVIEIMALIRNTPGLYDRAGWGETSTVDLLGDASATLASGTRLVKFSDFGVEDRMVILTGDATFDVAPSSLPPVVVRTQSAEITVVGTRFRVHAYEWEPTELTVERGTVTVRARNKDGDVYGPSVPVTAGQRMRIIRGHIPEIVP